MNPAYVLALIVLFVSGTDYGNRHRKLDSHDFTSAKQCAACHSEIYEQWSSSTHSGSLTDPLFQSVLKKVLEQEGGRKRAVFCLRCHAPVAGVSGKLLRHSLQLQDFSPVEAEGVTCDFCHTISGEEPRPRSSVPAAYLFPRTGFTETKYGRLVATHTEAHPTSPSRFLTDSRMCAVCHSYKHPIANGAEIQNTYREWLASRYSKEGTQCQDCHMPVYSGRVADESSVRPDLHAHVFIGGHSSEIYKKAATLSLSTRVKKKGAKTRVNIISEVANTGAGHPIPTGIPGLRELRLVVTVKGPDGEHLGFRTYKYGQRLVARDGTERLPWESYKFLKDQRIPPDGSRREDFEVSVDSGLKGDLRIEGNLYVLLVSHAMSSRLGLASPEPLLMCSASTVVTLP